MTAACAQSKQHNSPVCAAAAQADSISQTGHTRFSLTLLQIMQLQAGPRPQPDMAEALRLSPDPPPSEPAGEPVYTTKMAREQTKHSIHT